MRSNYSREERQKIVEEYIQSRKSQTVFAPVMEQEHHVLFCPLLKCKSEYFNRLSQMSF